MPLERADTSDPKGTIQLSRVVANRRLCREHYRLTFRLPDLAPARPGQFVHINPEQALEHEYRTFEWQPGQTRSDWLCEARKPMLRRAFSIAALERKADGVYVDVIYRVVGTATRWMQSLSEDEPISVLGPLGNTFPVHDAKPVAWLVAGGVGLPPMLWLAEALQTANKRTVAFCGAQTADLLPLSLDANAPPAVDAARATRTAIEFAREAIPVVLSTDDGSLGFHGHVGAALTAYHDANPTASDEAVVYTCGPERMMEFVAEYCLARKIECHVCMERAMACGTGTCQSCVVEVRDQSDPAGWRYQLCCTDGPVFDARRIMWKPR
jgi:dihydroorotate dehydrogenase electron transfer subunit